MSDDDIYFDDPEDYVEPVLSPEENATGAYVPEEEEDTPDLRYRRAKDQINFDNDSALAAFTSLFEDTAAPSAVREKALCRLVLLRRPDEVSEVLRLLFDAHSARLLSQARFDKVVMRLADSLVASESAQKIFFKDVTDRLDKNASVGLFLDLKLRQADLYLRCADFRQVKELISDALQYCPIPPDRNNSFLCRCAIRLLVLQIEIAEHEGNEDQVFKLFDKAQDIPRLTLNPRQQATLTRLEGFRHLKKKNFAQARTCFWSAFTQFSEAGADKQVRCLQFCALAALCCHETVSMFNSPEANHLAAHVVTAPIAQLTDAYLEPNIGLFAERLESTRVSFGNDECYNELLDEVRVHVLKRSLLVYCPMFSVVSFEYAARELASGKDEVRDLVEELILRKQLNGLMDEEREMVYIEPVRQKSVFVQNIRALVDELEKTVVGLIESPRS